MNAIMVRSVFFGQKNRLFPHRLVLGLMPEVFFVEMVNQSTID